MRCCGVQRRRCWMNNIQKLIVGLAILGLFIIGCMSVDKYCIHYWIKMRYKIFRIFLKNISINIPFLIAKLLFVLIIFVFGYIFFCENKLGLFNPIDWVAISGIIQLIVMLIMLITILIALFPRKIKKIKMFLIFSPDIESDIDNFVQVVISNSGNSPVILKKIEFWCGDWCFGEDYFIRDTYWLACSNIITIRPEQTKKIFVSYNQIRYNVGHTGCPYDQKEDDKYIEIRLTDIEEFTYRSVTKYKANLFLDLIFEKNNEEIIEEINST